MKVPLLDGKRGITKDQKTGILVIVAAIALIIIAVCTNFFGSEYTIFNNDRTPRKETTSTYSGEEEGEYENLTFSQLKEEFAKTWEEGMQMLEEGEFNPNYDKYLEEKQLTTQTVSSEDNLKVYFFDVGQGESIFVQNGENTMLIDAGNNPDGKYISKYLRNTLGIKKLDYLICTHAHEDHIGGIDIIIEDLDIGTFYMPSKAQEIKSYNDVVDWAKKKNLEIVSPTVGTKFSVGNAVCEIMTQNNTTDDINETTIACELTFGTQKFLFTGDSTANNEKSRIWNDIDVLKVSHHGSTYSSTEEFLKQVKPEIAVISCGANNDYYYPHEAVLNRLKAVGCNEIYVTATDGTILITSDGSKNTVTKLDVVLDGNLDNAA